MNRIGIRKLVLPALIIALIMVSGTLAAIYWSSPTFTNTITVTGAITAKANVDVANCFGAGPPIWMKGSYALCPTLTTFQPTNVIYVLVDSTNAASLYVTVTHTGNAGITVTCTAKLCHISWVAPDASYSLKYDTTVGSVPTDGSGPVSLTYSGDPVWLTKSKYLIDAGVGIRLLELTFTFNGATLPIGSYPVDVTVHLGDSL